MRPRATRREAASPTRRGAILAILIAGALPGRVWADPLVTDRPDFTESAETVPRHSPQIEGGYTFGRSAGEDEQTFGEVLLRLPLGARVEGRLGLGSYLIASGVAGSDDAYDDPSLGLKWKFHDAQPNGTPDVAALATVTYERRESTEVRHLIPEVKLLAARDLSARFGLSANLGAAFDEDGASYIASLSLGIDLGRPFGGFVEVFGFGPMRTRSGRSTFADTGLTFLLSDNLQLDARAGAGTVVSDHDVTDGAAFFGAGLSYRW